jgi:TIGR00341 family protein
MQLKIIEILGPRGHAETVVGIAESHDAVRCDIFHPAEGEHECIRILTAARDRQKLVDDIARLYSGCDDWRLSILPVDATVPQVREPEDEGNGERAKALAATREELYSSISSNAEVDTNFLVLVLLSTIVAGIGLIEDDTAVVIGAMVIAPLLGPNLAFSLGATLGDWRLMVRALKANVVGIGFAVLLCVLAGGLLPISLDSGELQARTDPSYANLLLALASGAAAAMSLTTGVASALVGVMVAVALLPPAAATGLLVGSGLYAEAAGAAVLLAANVICVNLAAQLVFLIRGMRPNSWFKRESAKQSTTVSIVAWLLLLAAVVGLLWLRSD